ncbi:OmpH family outer membrane protein [Epilithonimonas xixisoli]|uniref:Periplasmic chaperone for outer membrane proteins Skp n=1 Tax=Epilithonimonas xixisoli TaxID=1476462 RepID=A0A4R8IFL3_9FLAO|nr:OmpH family outer membrane protein [Epilithonimonas xixisoli]TDX84234.1 periplasmic chaperone for outer membrane proteins Skp [Epilithonimonas xixisoli]
MKKIAFIVTILFTATHIYAQKIGVVDTNYVLSKLPQFKEAENRLNTQVTQWQADLQKLQAEYERKREAFENEKVLLVGDQLKLREKEIVDMETSIRNTIGARFGTNGEVNQLRSNLTKPYQDQIWNAIKTVSTKNNLGIVLDKSNNISVIFLDKKYDYTEAVLNLLGKSLPKVEETKTSIPNRGGRPMNSNKNGKLKSNSASKKVAPIESIQSMDVKGN